MSNDIPAGRSKAMKQPGTILIISSPSGGGKTSICRRLLSRTRRQQGWTFSVSCTTRSPRVGERNGREYYFVSEPEFKRKIHADYFAEHFKVHRFHYGTPRGPLEKVIKQGGVMILDVDVNGAFALKREYPQAVTVFILPPSVRELRHRLRQRGTETKEELAVRFENARKEMQLFHRFDYVVINKELEVAVNEVLAIVEADPCRVDRADLEQIRSLTV
jgi:guanylate kinase